MTIKEPDCMIYGEEPDLLKKVFKDKRVIEIGAYEGGSTNIIASVAKEILSIDTFQADNIPGFHPKSTLLTFIKNKPDNANFIIGNSKSWGVHRRVQRGWYNGLFIDGDHSYDGALNDLIIYVDKLVKPAVIAMHDYGNPQFTGVMAAATNYFKRLPDEHLMGLAVWYLD